MIRSMTGFGRYEGTINGRDLFVEIRSVNHRYFEFSCRVTRGYGFIEDKLKKLVSQSVSRGKTEVIVSISAPQDDAVTVTVNHSLAAGYVNALRELAAAYELSDDISVSSVARYNDIFSVHKSPEDEEEVWNTVSQAVGAALDNFVAMREREGQSLKDDVLSRSRKILDIVSQIEERSPQTVSEYEQRLRAKIDEVIGNKGVDDMRVLTEVAIFADKVAVAEETVRLRSHFEQLEAMLEMPVAVGRKLDFILQEMNREANTIGSKCVDAKIAHLVVDIKAELEKIREQIQNIE